MLKKLKKHAGKIFVLVINFLLMTIAVLIIKEKDQNRLLKQTESRAAENASQSADLSSFEGQINRSVKTSPPAGEPAAPSAENIQPPAGNSETVAPAPAPADPPSSSSPAPTKSTSNANRKTQTS